VLRAACMSGVAGGGGAVGPDPGGNAILIPAIQTCNVLLMCTYQTISPQTCLSTMMHETPTVLQATRMRSSGCGRGGGKRWGWGLTTSAVPNAIQTSSVTFMCAVLTIHPHTCLPTVMHETPTVIHASRMRWQGCGCGCWLGREGTAPAAPNCNSNPVVCCSCMRPRQFPATFAFYLVA
jgi:hypothetical protein